MSTSVSLPPTAPSYVDCEPDAYTTQELAAYAPASRRAASEPARRGDALTSGDPETRARELKNRLRLAADALAVADLLIGMNDSVRSVGMGARST